MKVQLHPGIFALATLVAMAAQHERPGFAQSPDDAFGAAAARDPSAVAQIAPTAAGATGVFWSKSADGAPNPLGSVFVTAPDQPSLQQAAAAVRAAKDDAGRTTAQEQLQKLLNETFDADMKRRELELTKLEQRVEALRQQATRRQAKKADIIELQTRVLLNEADGLGFYSGGEKNSLNLVPAGEFYGGMAPMPAGLPGQPPLSDVARPTPSVRD
jgi:hypothetical protein